MVCGIAGNAGKFSLAIADELIFLFVADNFNPMIVEQLELDLGLRGGAGRAREVFFWRG